MGATGVAGIRPCTRPCWPPARRSARGRARAPARLSLALLRASGASISSSSPPTGVGVQAFAAGGRVLPGLGGVNA